MNRSLNILLLCVIIVACAVPKNMSFSESGGQIPPGWSKCRDTLLVVSHSEEIGYNHYLRNNFQQNYNGPVKIIQSSQAQSNYAVSTYPYLFDHHTNFKNKLGPNGTTRTIASSDYFFIQDRTSGKKYITQSSAYYSKLMRAYIVALEAARDK